MTTRTPSSSPGAEPVSPTAAGPTGPRWRRAWDARHTSLAFHHDFRQLWIGDTVSQVGTQLTMLALPVLAIRLLDADELQMGLLTAFETLAFLVIGLPAGAWVDRWRKKRVLVTGDVVRALALATLPLAWLLDVLTLTQVYAVALTVGAATVFFDVAYQSYLPELVPSNRISDGNAKLQASQSVAMVGGPAVGGQLIRLLGAPLTIALDAMSFLASAFFVSRIRHADEPPSHAERRPLLTEIREGLVFVLRHPLLLRITACTAISNLFSTMTFALLMLYALRDLGLTAGTMGTVFTVGALGALVGVALVGRIGRWVGEARSIPLSALTWAPGAALIPLAGSVLPAVPTLMASQFLFSFTVVVYNVTQVSFRQRVTPRRLLGRMNASVRFVVWGTMPVGGVVGGLLGSTIGIRPTLWVGVAGALLAALPVVVSPLLAMRDLPPGLDEHA